LGGGAGLRHGGAGEGGVSAEGLLGTARVVGTVDCQSDMFERSSWNDYVDVPASRLAGVVAVAVVNAVVAPLRADEVGQSLRVLCNVGRDAVFADTGVGQGISVAVVLGGGHRVNVGLLEADEGALCPVLVAPVLCFVVRWGLWEDGGGSAYLASSRGLCWGRWCRGSPSGWCLGQRTSQQRRRC
jgi:hypothetical protein